MHPLKFLIALLAAAVGLVGITAAGVAIYGRERLWQQAFGPPDLGPYDFAQPTRTGKLNDALACPENRCVDAGGTTVTPRFAVPAEALLAEARRLLSQDLEADVVDERPNLGTLRAVVRTRLLGLPDTVSVQVEADGTAASRLWLYSRSQVGHFDLGVNRDRIQTIVDHLAATLPLAGDSSDETIGPSTPADDRQQPRDLQARRSQAGSSAADAL